jgi:hypothetical protein
VGGGTGFGIVGNPADGHPAEMQMFVETTQIYLDANLKIKDDVHSRTMPINTKAARYRPSDDYLLAFLEASDPS